MQLFTLLSAISCLGLLLFVAPQGVHAITQGEPCNADDEPTQCDSGLFCLQDDFFSSSSAGTCQEISPCLTFGCEILNGYCSCSYSLSCPMKDFPFETAEECQANITEPDNCHDIVCPPFEEDCPVGSYYEPGPQSPDRCCPSLGVCVCDSERCPQPDCPSDSIPIVVALANETAGQCCDRFACQAVTCSLYLDEPRLLQNGESISPEVCTNCTCMNGELICETIECPSLECGELEVKAYIPGKCCPVCSPRLVIDPIEPEPECTEPEGRLFRDPEDPCMTCRCSRGRKSCVSELCPSSDCANPVLVPGVCCPVCPEITPEPVETTESPRGPIIDPFVTPAPECNRRGFFRDPTDPCKTCRCVNGAAECYDDSERFCGPTPCENPVRIPGNCCPVCPLPDLETTIEQVTMNTDTTNTPQTNFEIVIILDLPTTEYLELEDFIKNRIGNLLTTIGFQLQTISGTQAPGKTQTQLLMVIESSGIDNSLTEAQLTALITEELQALLTEGLSTPSPNIATTTDSTLIKSEETAKELMVIVLVGAFSASVAVIVTLIGTVIVAILIIRHKRNRLSKHREQTSSQTKLNPV